MNRNATVNYFILLVIQNSCAHIATVTSGFIACDVLTSTFSMKLPPIGNWMPIPFYEYCCWNFLVALLAYQWNIPFLKLGGLIKEVLKIQVSGQLCMYFCSHIILVSVNWGQQRQGFHKQCWLFPLLSRLKFIECVLTG